MTLAFRVLGPLDVHAGERRLPLGGVKPRMLLATLLLEPNRVVSAEALVDVLWPAAPPRSALANVRTYVSTLRTVLAERDRIRSEGTGYAVRVEPHELDLLVSDELVGAARLAGDRGEPDTALRLLRRADALWRGPPLDGLGPNPAWEAELGRIVERRLTATEHRIALQIRLGDHADVVPELRKLLVEHPLREGLWQQLMLALDAAGRRAEAVQSYAELRRLLAAELGVEPGPELRRLHSALLGEPRNPTRVRQGGPAVWQVPPSVADFTGRDDDVRELAAALTGPAAAGAPNIAVVVGAPGTGKSALAVHTAHLLRDRFPDGQLYLDLAGTTQPRGPAEMLAELLRSLGAAGAAVPDELDERAAAYRTRLAGRRLLVVLDDAADAAQVRPLLPATNGCAVLVTGRHRLTELPGCRQLSIDGFSEDEALALLGRIAGPSRVAREPAAAAAIVRACGHLPLAIRIAGAKLAGRQAWSLRELADRLADESRRLSELRLGQLGVRASIDLSYRLLDGDVASAFRLFGLLPARPLPGWVVAALLDRRHADDVLDAMVDQNLLGHAGQDTTGASRYRMHDLLRVYAREAVVADPAPARDAAVGRVLDGWLARAELAADGLPHHVFSRTSPAGPTRSLPVVDRPLDALSWFDAERSAMVAAVATAAELGMAEPAWRLAVALVPYFDLCSHHDDWRRSHELAIDAVRAAGDRAGEAMLLRGLAQVHLYRDCYATADETFERARRIFREVGDRRGEVSAVCGLATGLRLRGRLDAALRLYRQVLDVQRAMGDEHGQAYALTAIGSVRLAQGRHADAAAAFGDALRLSELLGDRHRQAHVLHKLGELHHRCGEAAAASGRFAEALAIFGAISDEHGRAYVLHAIGKADAAAGDHAAATRRLGQAVGVYRRLGDRSAEVDALRLLARSHRQLGDIGSADSQLAHARRLSRDLQRS